MKQKTVRALSIIWYLLVICLLVTTLFHYCFVYNINKSIKSSFLDAPNQYHGIKKQTMGPFSHSFDGGFFIDYNQKLIPVHYDKEYLPPHYGEVLVFGVYHKDGYIDAIAVHNYNYNYVLYILSFITAVFVIIFFFTEWKITLRGFKSA